MNDDRNQRKTSSSRLLPTIATAEEYDPIDLIDEQEHLKIVHEDLGAEGLTWQLENGSRSQSLRRAPRRGARAAHHNHTVVSRQLPHRESRVKSFRQLLGDRKSEQDGRKSVVSNVMAPSRVFVTNEVEGMHLDWPLYSQQAESFSTAAHIIISDAALVQTSAICTAVPQEFTEVGTFVVSMTGLQHRHEVTLDGLGSWGTPQGTTKFYHFCAATRKLMIATPDDYTYKVQCNRYIHPGTDERGHFIRKIYCGMTSGGEGCSHAVITYSWEGTPHPIAVAVPSSTQTRERPYGARSWEASDVDITADEGVTHHGLPLLSRVAVDFDLACKVLLGGVDIPSDRICTRVPSLYRDGGTFIVNIDACGGERSLCKDGHEWLKPSGSSRYFRFDEDDNVTRVDRAGAAPFEHYDVQVVAKRYESSDVPGFVRKLYVVRDRADEDRVNSHIAVLTYHWKSEPVVARANRDAIIARKRQADQLETPEGRAVLNGLDPPLLRVRPSTASNLQTAIKRTSTPKSLSAIDTLSQFRLSHADHMRRLAITKKSENLCRLAAILDRAEPILERFEQYFLSNCSTVRDQERVWMEQSQPHQVLEQRGTFKANHNIEECVVVNEQGEPIQLPPGCEIVYENANDNSSFQP